MRKPVVNTDQNSRGAVLHVYERAGDVRHGEVGTERAVVETNAA